MFARKPRVLFLTLIVVLLIPLAPSWAVEPAGHPTEGVSPSADFGIDILSSGDSRLIFSLPLPDYQVETVKRDGVSYQEIVVDAAGWAQASINGQVGAPQLPARGLLLAVPPAGDVSLRVLAAEAESLPGRFTLSPAPEVRPPADLSSDEPVQQSWRADQAAYAPAEWLPAQQAEILEEGWLRGQRFVRLSLRPFQVNPALGLVRAAADLRVELAFSEPASPVGSAEQLDPLFEDIFRATFPNYSQAAGWRARPEPVAMPAGADDHSSGDWVKITVDADGLYRVDYAALAASAVPTSTLNALNPRTFRLEDEEVEQAIVVEGEGDGSFDEGDAILFYGRRDAYYLSDDNNVYWLTWGGADGLRMATIDGTPAGATAASTLLTTRHWEEHDQGRDSYKVQRPWAGWLETVEHDHWFWKKLSIGSAYTINVASGDTAVDVASSVQPTMTLWLIGNERDGGNYSVSIDLNGTVLGPVTWSGDAEYVAEAALPAGLLVDGANTLKLTALNAMSTKTSDYSVWLDWIEITYPYNSVYLNGTVFSNPDPGAWAYQISGLPGSAAWILKITDPEQPELVTNASPAAAAKLAGLDWQMSSAANDRFIVVAEEDVQAPVAVDPFVMPDLLDINQQMDYLIISHKDFLANVQPLAAAHAADWSVKVVDVQDIYDVFSDGGLRAEAIKDYLAYAYSNYPTPALTFVLLVGDGTVDFRGYRYNQPPWHLLNTNKIPPYVGGFDPLGGGDGISDNAFGFLQGDDVLSELLIGRLPVNTTDQADLMVNRILNYSAGATPDWALSTLWVADNPDVGGDFYQASDSTIDMLPPEFDATRIYYCDPAYNSPCSTDPWYYTDKNTTTAAIVDEISNGHLLINYTGHGGYGVWGHEWLFINSNVDQLTNGDKAVFSVISACATAYFAFADGNGLEERFMRHTNGGAVGGFAPTTFDLLGSQTVLVHGFYDALMRNHLTRVGMTAAVAKATAYISLPVNYNSYTAIGHILMGDPALQLLNPAGDCDDGDIDCDVDTDTVDLQRVAWAWNSFAWDARYHPRADLNHDGRVDIDDIIAAAELWNAEAAR